MVLDHENLILARTKAFFTVNHSWYPLKGSLQSERSAEKAFCSLESGRLIRVWVGDILNSPDLNCSTGYADAARDVTEVIFVLIRWVRTGCILASFPSALQL